MIDRRRGRVAVAIALSLAACARAEPPASTVIYAAASAPGPAATATARAGVATPRLALTGLPIVGEPGVTLPPLAMIELVGSQGPGPVEAALSGRTADGPAIDLIVVDAGVVRWRDRRAALPAVAVVDDRVIAAGGERIVVLDRATGTERARLEARWLRGGLDRDGQGLALIALRGGVAWMDRAGAGAAAALPAGAAIDDVVAVCDLGARFALAWRDGALTRWDLAGTAVTVAWSTPMPRVARVACDAAPLVVLAGGEARAVAPDDGRAVGGPIAAHDGWADPLDPTRVELATAAGVEVRSRDLATVHRATSIAVERLVAARGPRRVLTEPGGDTVLLDGERGAIAAAPGGSPMVVLGEHALVAGPWRFPRVSQQQQPSRYAWPTLPAAPIALATTGAPLVASPPRIDLPAPTALPDGVEADGGAWAVGALAIDPFDPERLHAIVLDDRPTATTGAGLASFDLHASRWRWLRRDGCPPGTPIALAVAGPVVVCAARGPVIGAGAVVAVSNDGGARAWRWDGATVDGVLGGGDAIAILAGAEVVVVDAATGLTLTRWRSHDGYVGRVALALRGTDTRLASYEDGAVVVRSRARGWQAVSATAIDGAVASVLAIGDRFAVALTDGTLYFLDDTGAAIAAGAVASGWQPRGDRAVLTRRVERDGAMIAVDPRGVVRAEAALADAMITGVGSRAAVAGAPFAVTTDAGEVIALDPAGAARLRFALPEPGAQAFTTVLDGTPVAGVVAAGPLRVVVVPVP